jgi:2-polyprenyl-3-methyl-5-hydroxy-6-metoxy-1,4-benzoquinol methylase
MTEKKDTVPTTNADFDKQYGSIPHWVWRDVRVPGEIKQLVKRHKPQSSLELGCGAGLFSTFVGKQGVQATGVDFSKVAIGKANERASGERSRQRRTDIESVDK